VTGEILLVRHTEVARYWHGRCYGRSDAGLSRYGAMHAVQVADRIAAWQPDVLVHSGLRRAARLANLVTAQTGLTVIVDAAWVERHFGTWEGQKWAAIYRATGSAMDGMIDAPGSFRPGGGETTDELADRAVLAFDRLPAGRVAVVSHGGPIASVLGRRAGLPSRDWLTLVPAYGSAIGATHG
jgi:broad specificity phosphatase PhoE